MKKLSKKHLQFSRSFITTIQFCLLVIAITTLNSCGNSNKTNSVNKKPEAFSFYKNQRQQKLAKIDAELKMNRKRMLAELENNPVFIDLVRKKVLDQKYLVLLEAIGEGSINSTVDNNFTIKESSEKELSNIEGGLKFVINSISLGCTGGVNNEILDLFSNYANEFGISGSKGDVKYNADGNVKYTLDQDFTLIQFLAIADSKNREILDSYYENINNGRIDWLSKSDIKYKYEFLADKYAFNNYLKENYPESKHFVTYKLKLSASDLYLAYDANEVSADENYKNKRIAITGAIKDIGNDITDDAYITLETGNYGVIQCSFPNKSSVKPLYKGEKLTVVGNCSGKTLGNIILFDSVVF